MNSWLLVMLLTATPLFELRAAIPVAIAMGLHWLPVFFVVYVVNVLIGFMVWFILRFALGALRRIAFIDRCWVWYTKKVQLRIDKTVERFGRWALAAFIAVPLPGSGVYSGAVAALLIGADTKQFVLACLVGVFIAAVIVTIISVLGVSAAWAVNG